MLSRIFLRTSVTAERALPAVAAAELGLAAVAVALGLRLEAPRAFWYAAAPGAFAVLTALRFWLFGWT